MTHLTNILENWRSLPQPAKLALIGFQLGIFFCIGIFTAINIHGPAGVYIMLAYGIYHMTEFLVTAILRPQQVSTKSFLLQANNNEYTYAHLLCWIEFLSEWYFCPQWKVPNVISYVSITLCAVGYLIRVVAMIQARDNFNHDIEEKRRTEHVLITNGIYSYLRHPSYFGWFWYATLSQVAIGNPLCFVGYTVVSILFFRKRIRHEESILTKDEFFGTKYKAYKEKTYIGIPFV